ncbi:MAG: helix-turn-helix transcriptional regulator [Gelidibacter sp.]
MRNEVARQILEETPIELKEYISLCSDILVRIHDLIEEKGYSQRQLAKGLGKSPSEISKWLSGEHNFTLKSLVKLKLELGEPIIYVPSRKTFTRGVHGYTKMTALKNVFTTESFEDVAQQHFGTSGVVEVKVA